MQGVWRVRTKFIESDVRHRKCVSPLLKSIFFHHRIFLEPFKRVVSYAELELSVSEDMWSNPVGACCPLRQVCPCGRLSRLSCPSNVLHSGQTSQVCDCVENRKNHSCPCKKQAARKARRPSSRAFGQTSSCIYLLDVVRRLLYSGSCLLVNMLEWHLKAKLKLDIACRTSDEQCRSGVLVIRPFFLIFVSSSDGLQPNSGCRVRFKCLERRTLSLWPWRSSRLVEQRETRSAKRQDPDVGGERATSNRGFGPSCGALALTEWQNLKPF